MKHSIRFYSTLQCVVVCYSAAFFLRAFGATELEGRRAKFIELGWDIPSTALMRENWQQMEKTAPFDGVMFKVELTDDQGRRRSSEAVWDGRAWQRQWLQTALSDLKSCHFTRFSDNFLRFNATPGNLDWADDTGWAVLAEKAGDCAWLMRQAGAKGLAIDFESYGAHQFRFDTTRGRSFAETTALARRRGGQFVQAVGREFPEAVLLTLWMNSINLRAGDSDSPDTILASSGYGLLPAFIDGMLGAVPPKMVLVDGCESGYYLDSAEAYLRTAREMRAWNGGAIRLVSPENRSKYLCQVQAGFGFYLDMFLNESTNRYYRGPINGSRLAHLERNLAFARDAADEYVWVYGEQCRWWGRPLNTPRTVGKGRLWEEALPGITRAIAYVRDPVRAAREDIAAVRSAGTLKNLARNADFTQAAGAQVNAPPADFSVWQDETAPTGQFGWDSRVGNGSARATGATRGCFLQAVSVNPGETYAVQAESLAHGLSSPTLMVRWQTAEGRWTHEPEDRTFAFMQRAGTAETTEAQGKARAGDWRQAFGVAMVPPEVGKLVVLLNVAGQPGMTNQCWFDNLGVFRLR